LSPNIYFAYPGFFLATKVLELSVNLEKRDFQQLSISLLWISAQPLLDHISQITVMVMRKSSYDFD
jgi:hypothetical protein